MKPKLSKRRTDTKGKKKAAKPGQTDTVRIEHLNYKVRLGPADTL